MKINHIGYMVSDVQKAINKFSKLGYQLVSSCMDDEVRGIFICFLEKDGYCIELVSPKDEHSVIYQTHKKLGNMPYHICYEVDDLDNQIQSLKKDGYILTQPIQKAIAFQGKSVAFLFNKDIGLIELVER